MKKLFVVSLFLLSVGAQAEIFGNSGGSSNRMMPIHGGLGFLYTDFNNFVNPAHLGLEKGVAVQAEYTNGNGIQTGTPSFAASNGRVGIEVFGSRSSDDLTDAANATDIVGGGLGFALGKSAALGFSYQDTISANSTNNGTAAASLELHGSGGMEKGIGLAVGASTTINDSVANLQTGTVALGWSFRHNNNFEVEADFNDLSNFNNFNASAVLTLGSPVVYFSGMYTWLNNTQQNEVAGRLGFNVSRNCDISGLIGYTLNNGTNPVYGGTLRVGF
jgi:hypothetical protein